ncbi:MAG: hypothetical protein WCW13_01005 [archaeon]|jgi:ribonuclease P protein subunit RPR2
MKTKTKPAEKEKDTKSGEKNLKGNQNIALERIYRLFELAEGNDKYQKRYLQLAKRIGEKCRVQISKELKIKYCKKCYSMKVLTKEEKPFLVVKCTECGFVKRFGLKEKK